jgi:hypothetical protein
MKMKDNVPYTVEEISEIWWLWLKGWSYAELAIKFEREENAIKSLIFRIRKNRSDYDGEKGKGRVYCLSHDRVNFRGKRITKRMEIYIRDQLRAKKKISKRGIAYNIGHSVGEVEKFVAKHPYLTPREKAKLL